MTLTKADIVEEVSKIGFSKNTSVHLVERVLEIIKATLGRGEDLLVSGFGKFYLRLKAERTGRNPGTGVEAIVTERRVVRFKCSGKLRDRINRPL